MKILIAGLGSIGQRHARNVRAALGDDVDIIAYRVRGLSHVINEDMTIGPGNVERAYGIRSFHHLDRALAERPDAAFICGPTSTHIDTALASVRSGCHLFIEKPLSHTAAGVDALIQEVAHSGRVAAVGYQLRFHPALQSVGRLLSEGAIGRVRSVKAEFCEFLPSAHPYEDYRHSYAARADLGGGVILCYIHEVDYLCWLFGLPERLRTIGGRRGTLEIDVEDTAITTFDYATPSGLMSVRLETSFIRQPASRRCTIIGDAGTIDLDLLRPTVTVTTSSLRSHQTFPAFRRNQLFEDELSNFLAAIDGRETPAVPLRDAARSLDVALAMRESLARGTAVELHHAGAA